MTKLPNSPCDETLDAVRVPRIYKIPSFIPLRSIVSLLEFIRETRQSIEIAINICKGKKVAVVFRDDDWNLLSETLDMDARSANFEHGLREDIESALGRAIVLDIDPLVTFRRKLRQIERRIKTAIRKAEA
jgi:hypothetical protein